jgi:ribokinase
MIKTIVLSGFATLDYVAVTNAPLAAPGTTIARLARKDSWPRPGGAPLYAGARLAMAGHAAYPLVTIGDDAHSDLFMLACRQASLALNGVVRQPQSTTPCCVMIHAGDGASQCLLDPGTASQGRLNDRQRKLAADADLIVLTAAEPGITTALCASIKSHQQLAWIAKDDGISFPAELRAALSARADYIFCNQFERALCGNAKHEAILVETKGSGGANWVRHGNSHHVAATIQATADATGAGDTLAGEILARLLLEPNDVEAAVAAGVAAAASLLSQRATLH